MKAFNFEYKAVIEKKEDCYRVKSYNSPYAVSQDSQSIDDILYAIEKQKVLGDELDNGVYLVHLVCKFIENSDGSFDQIFSLIKKEGL